MIHNQDKKAFERHRCPKMIQILELADKDLKEAMINVFGNFKRKMNIRVNR